MKEFIRVVKILFTALGAFLSLTAASTLFMIGINSLIKTEEPTTEYMLSLFGYNLLIVYFVINGICLLKSICTPDTNNKVETKSEESK